MMILYARYRGDTRQRAQLVRASAQALSKLEGIGPFEVTGVEEIRAQAHTPEGLCDAVMALLADGQWALGLVLGVDAQPQVIQDRRAGHPGFPRGYSATMCPIAARARPGSIAVRVGARRDARSHEVNIAGALTLLHHVFSRRTVEGREATALVRAGLTQSEAAAELGVSKQAISQRLQAAGWAAEKAGWALAVNLLSAAVTSPAGALAPAQE